MLSLISDAAKEAFPSTKQTDLFPYHRVLCHRPQGLSCCSHPPQDRLLPRHSCQENSCLDLHAEMLSSSAVPTKLHLLACQPRTVTSNKGENRKKKKDKSCCAYNAGDLNEALTLFAGLQVLPDRLGYPAIPPPAAGPQPLLHWHFLKQHASVLMLHNHFDPSHFAAQKR